MCFQKLTKEVNFRYHCHDYHTLRLYCFLVYFICLMKRYSKKKIPYDIHLNHFPPLPNYVRNCYASV